MFGSTFSKVDKVEQKSQNERQTRSGLTTRIIIFDKNNYTTKYYRLFLDFALASLKHFITS